MDATLVPMLANLADKKGSRNYGAVYALQQISVCLAYSFGPLLGGEAVRVIGFPWLMRLSGFLNILFCPLLLELGEKQQVGVEVMGRSRRRIGMDLFQDEMLPSYSSIGSGWSQIEEKLSK